MTRIVAFVPAKGSSDRIQNKNLAILDGEHLFKRKLRQLLACPVIDQVVLDTDNDPLAALAADLGVTRLQRPSALASNATDGHALFAWECAQVPPADLYLQTLCTAPFVNAATVQRAIDALQKSPEHDSLVAITRAKQYTWSNGEPDYGRGRIPNSVDLPAVTIEAMSLYIVRASVLASGRRFGSKPLLFELSPTEAIDVNWPEELVLAETIAAGERAHENLRLASLTPYLTSAMLSDITHELRVGGPLPREITGGGRFFGRAKTMLLDRVGPDESWRGIYDALDSYQFIRPGDAIVVENRVKDRAYFGNLNAQLAMRAGACGAVINGVTRDHDDVLKLGFPVFARGHYCADIKFEGTMRSMNMPIDVGGVPVRNGDYVFADRDGVVVIPFEHWSVVCEHALRAIEKEWRIGMAVALGAPPKRILSDLGEF